MEMILADNNVNEEYIEWLFRKEESKKRAQQLWTEYLHVFGNLVEENYRWKCACKYLQKSIQYRKQRMDPVAIEELLKNEMEKDLKKWTALCEEIEKAKCIQYIPKCQLEEIEAIFFQINQKLQYNEELLWKSAKKAYLENDLDTLRTINKQLSISQSELSLSFMELETRKLKQEVKEIRKKDIIPYSSVLDSVDNIQSRNKHLKEEIRSYKYFHKHLKKEYRLTL